MRILGITDNDPEWTSISRDAVYTYYAPEKGNYTLTIRHTRTDNNDTSWHIGGGYRGVYYYNTDATDVSGDGTDCHGHSYNAPRNYTITVTKPGFIHVKPYYYSDEVKIVRDVTASTETSSSTSTISGYGLTGTQATASNFASLVAGKDKLFVLADAAADEYWLSNANPMSGEGPDYAVPQDLRAVPSQLWLINDAGDGYYTLQSYTTGRYPGGWNAAFTKEATHGTYRIDVADKNFHLRSLTNTNADGRYMGPWNNNGAVSLTANANGSEADNNYERVANNKPLLNAPGFHIYAIDRAAYEEIRRNGQTLMNNGWTIVTKEADLGQKGYEYVLLDCNQNGVESGYATTGNEQALATGNVGGYVRYNVLSAQKDLSGVQRWLMGSHSGGGYYLQQNVSGKQWYLYYADAASSRVTDDLAGKETNFLITSAGLGLWYIQNGSHDTTWGGANDTPYNPVDNFYQLFSKADGNRRPYKILRRPTGNLGMVDYDGQGWTELDALPTDLDDYFYSYYSLSDGLGIGVGLALGKRTEGTHHGGNLTMVYTADLDPNTNKAGVWTLTKEGTTILNTNIMEPEHFLQTEMDKAHQYRINDNGGVNSGNISWGSLLFNYNSDTSNKTQNGWLIENGKYTGNWLGNWGETGNNTNRNPSVGEEVAFNKTAAGRDYYDIYAIKRGKYVEQDTYGKTGERDISYVINNGNATQRVVVVKDVDVRPLGWQMTGDGFKVQNNDAYAGKVGNYYFEAYNGSVPLSDREIYQDYTEMPDGWYTVTVRTNATADFDGAYLVLNGRKVSLSEAVDGKVSLRANLGSGHVKFGIQLKGCNQRWVAFDDFHLTYSSKNDVTDDYLANPSFELKNDADGYLMGWKVNHSSVSTAEGAPHTGVRSVTGSDGLTAGPLSGVDGDKFFNTWDNTNDADKTLYTLLDLQTTTTQKMPAGSYRLSALIAGYDGAHVVMSVFTGDEADGSDVDVTGTPLNYVDYSPATNNADSNYGANTGVRHFLLFTLSEEKYVTIYIYNNDNGTPFFKVDDLRLVAGGHTANIAQYILPNPSFEYADASGSLAQPEVVYSTVNGINRLGMDASDGAIYGWDISDMDQTGGTANRIALGTNDVLDYYAYLPSDDSYMDAAYNGNLYIPSAASGTRYLYNGRYRRNTGGEEHFSLSTTTTGTLPIGCYIANIKYKATTSYNGGWPADAANPGYLTFTVKDESNQTIATSRGTNFPRYDRDEGNARKNRNYYFHPSGAAWQKMSVIFVIDEPTAVTFTINEYLQESYATDIIIDDLRLVMMNIPEKPEHCAEGSIEDGTDYFFVNAATGQYLMGDNEYGTHAALVPHGMPFKAVKNGDNWQFDSQVFYDGETNHYLTGSWVDNVATDFTVESVGASTDGKFTLKVGDNYLTATGSTGNRVGVDMISGTSGSLLAQWYLVSKKDREDNLLSATAKDMDATFYIPNASFSRNMNTTSNTNTWAEPAIGNDVDVSDTDYDEYKGTHDFTSGTNVAKVEHKSFHVWKTIAVPNGTYKLRCQGFYRQDGSDYEHLPEFYVDDESTTLPEREYGEGDMAAAASSFVEGRYYTDYVTVKVTNNLLTVGLRLDMNDMLWTVWDNIEMELVSQNNPATSDYNDITNKIAEMTGSNLGFDGGQWAPYVATDCKAIVNGGAIDQGYPRSYDKVASYFESLKNTDFANAFYRGTFGEYRNYDIIADRRADSGETRWNDTRKKTQNIYRFQYDYAEAKGWATTGTAPTALGIVGLKATDPAYGNTKNAGLSGIDSKKALYIAAGTTATYGTTTGYEMPLAEGISYEISFDYGGWDAATTLTLTGKDGDGSTAFTFTPKEGLALVASTPDVKGGSNEWKTYTGTFTVNKAGGLSSISIAATGGDAVVSNLSILFRSSPMPSGIYYLYNKGTGKYLAAGYHQSDYPTGATGTHMGVAAILDEAGLDVTTADFNTGFSMDSRIYDTSTSHYIGNVLVDGGRNIPCNVEQATWYRTEDVRADDGRDYFHIYNASRKYLAGTAADTLSLKDAYNTADENQKWTLVTRAERIQQLTDMTPGAAAVDATFLLPGASFVKGDHRVTENWLGQGRDRTAAGRVDTWSNFNFQDNLNGDYYVSAPGWGPAGFEKTAVLSFYYMDFDIYQEISDAPAGVYTLSAQGAWRHHQPLFYIYDYDNKDITAKKGAFAGGLADKGTEGAAVTAATAFADGDYQVNVGEAYVFENTGTAKFRVGAAYAETFDSGLAEGHIWDDGQPQWAMMDNFKLTYRPFKEDDVNNYTGILKADDPAAVVAYAPNRLYNRGTGAFQIDTDTETSCKALNDEIAKQKGHLEGGEGTTETNLSTYLKEIVTKVHAFNALPREDFVVNAPAAGAYFNLVNLDYGQTAADARDGNKALTFLAGSNASGVAGTSMGWMEPAGSYFPQNLQLTPKATKTAFTYEDQTSKVATDGWLKSDGSASGTTSAANGNRPEVWAGNFANAANLTGTQLYQDVTGLPAGTYRIVLTATSHNPGNDNGKSTLKGTRDDVAYVFAQAGSGAEQKVYFRAHGVESALLANEEPYRCVIRDVVVGEGETLRLGLGTDEANVTGWHTIQIQSLHRITTPDASPDAVVNGYTMSYVRADGTRVYVGSGLTTGGGGNTLGLRPTTNAGEALTIKVVANSDRDGTWWLRNTEADNAFIGGQDVGFYTAANFKNLAIQTAVPTKFNSSIAAGKYSTLILPFDCTLPEGMEAYTINGVEGDEGNVLTLTKATSLQAMVPYIVKAGDTKFDYAIEGTGKAYVDDSYQSADNWLVGALFNRAADNDLKVPAIRQLIPVSDEDYKTYVLNTQNGKQAFYVNTKTTTAYCQANKTYMRVPRESAASPGAPAGVKQALFFRLDGATGIEEAVVDIFDDDQVEAIYDLRGMRRERLEKGVNIVRMTSGKTRKVMVK